MSPLRQPPVVAIADFVAGAVACIRGTVGCAEPLVGPLSGRACVYYAITIEELGARVRHQVVRETRSVGFRIVDASGVAWIDGEAAHVRGARGVFAFTDISRAATDAQRAYLARHGEVAEGAMGIRNLELDERSLEVGATVRVTGTGTFEPDPDGAGRVTGYRDAPPLRLHLTGVRGARLHVDVE